MEKSAERTFNEALEFAKTWFVLAEILAVLAGLFLIASSGYITPPYEISNFYGNIFSICKDYESIGRTYAAQNFTFDKCRTGFENDFGEFIREGNARGIFLFFVGMLFAVNALVCWGRGRYRIRKPRKVRDARFVAWLLMIDGIILLFMVIKAVKDYFPT